MKVTTFDRRVAALEQRRVYRIASLADVVILAAWRQRGAPKAPAVEDVEWDRSLEELWESCWERFHET